MQRFAPVEALFKGRHFDGQIIILCISWYTSFKLSLRDLVIMMADMLWRRRRRSPDSGAQNPANDKGATYHSR